MLALTCTSCAGTSVEVNPAHPSLDDRYPLGHCVVCTPWPKPIENPNRPGAFTQPPRKTIALIHSDLFDRAAFDHRRKVENARRLATRLYSKTASRMSETELAAASEAVAWLRRVEA